MERGRAPLDPGCSRLFRQTCPALPIAGTPIRAPSSTHRIPWPSRRNTPQSRSARSREPSYLAYRMRARLQASCHRDQSHASVRTQLVGGRPEIRQADGEAKNAGRACSTIGRPTGAYPFSSGPDFFRRRCVDHTRGLCRSDRTPSHGYLPIEVVYVKHLGAKMSRPNQLRCKLHCLSFAASCELAQEIDNALTAAVIVGPSSMSDMRHAAIRVIPLF